MTDPAWDEPAASKAPVLDAENKPAPEPPPNVEAPPAENNEKVDLGGPLVRPAGKPFVPSTVSTDETPTVNYRVTEPRVEKFVFHGMTVTRDWSPVPSERLSELVSAAREAGVALEAEV
jgi:hypothetical protein